MKKLKPFLVIFTLFLIASNSRAQKDDCACCSDNHRAFDFWVGTWRVTNADGALVGTNTIVKSENDCVVRENWISSRGSFTGTSTNFYNLQTKQWEQLWIDNSGAHLKLKGNRIGDQMILSSEEFENAEGDLNRNRIIWTKNDDGTVRQLWEILQGDKVQTVVFDGLYRKDK